MATQIPIKMELSFLALALFTLVCSVGVTTARKFDNFVINVEHITKTNADCKETVDEQSYVIDKLKVISVIFPEMVDQK